MSRRQSLDRPGILSPPGPFLTPSPSPSISASPRLQPSPSISPFPQDVLLVAGNPIANTTHDQERKAATPGRRQSLHQFTNGSPNAGTVVFQPSPSQSPAAATSVIGVTAGVGGAAIAATTPAAGNEFNTTLVGSNNIQLNKQKGNKRTTQQQQHQQQQQLQQQQQQQNQLIQQHHQIFSSAVTPTTYHTAPSISNTVASGYGQPHAAAINTPSFATANVAGCPKGQAKKGNTAVLPPTTSLSQHHQQQFQHYHSSSPLIADSPIPSPSNTITAAAIKPPTPQPMQMLQQQFTITGSAPHSTNQGHPTQQVFQIIQGPQGQIVAAPAGQQQSLHQRLIGNTAQVQTHLAPTSYSSHNSTTTNTITKSTKPPQQILPKPQQHPFNDASQQQSQQQQQHKAKGSIGQATSATTHTSTNNVAQMPQISQSPQPQQAQISVSATPTSGAAAQQQQIILPTGATASLTTTQQPLLLNQMPVLVQQNTPQGVQLILRPPTPQLTATPSLVIQNARAQPQLQQQQPQQLLRILGTNGATMQLAAATPTFIVSSQANLIQQTANHIQTIKTNPQNAAITQLTGLHAALSATNSPRSHQPFTATATLNTSHLLGPSVAAQLQNLQLAAAAANGSSITQIQMPNGPSSGTTILSQLPSQFQQNLNNAAAAGGSLINLNQLSSANIQQLAAAAAAAGATFHTPPPPATSSAGVDMYNAQHTTLPNLTHTSQASEPMRQSTSTSTLLQNPTGTTVAINQQLTNVHQTPSMNSGAANNGTPTATVQIQHQPPQAQTEPKKKARPRKKKSTAASVAAAAVAAAAQLAAITTTAASPALQAKNATIAVSTASSTANTVTNKFSIPASISHNPISTPQIQFTQSSPPNVKLTFTHNSGAGNVGINQSTQPQELPHQQQEQVRPKLDLGNVMKLCGIMEDDDEEEDYMEVLSTQEETAPITVPAPSQPTPTSLSSSTAPTPPNANDIMISIPSQNGSDSLPFTVTIPAAAALSAAAASNNAASDSTEPHNIFIKIDQNDTSTTPYTISIPRLPTAEEIQQQAQQHLAQQAAAAAAAAAAASQQQSNNKILPPTSFNMSTGNAAQLQPMQMPQTQPNIMTTATSNAPLQLSASNSGPTISIPTPATTTATTTATVKPRRKPAVRRNGKKQEISPATSIIATTTTGTLTATTSVTTSNNSLAATVTTATSAAASPAQTQSHTGATQNTPSLTTATATAPTVAATQVAVAPQVPSQIGNIQISQVDGTKLLPNHNGGGAVENKIQIMPILESATGATAAHIKMATQPPTAQYQSQTPQQHQQQILFQSPQPPTSAQKHEPTAAIKLTSDGRQVQLVAIPQTSGPTTAPGNQTPTMQQQPISSIASSTGNINSSITSAPPTQLAPQFMPSNVSISVGSPASAAALIPQLTGSLTLAVSEHCERLILRHDPNQPQDQQSQLILQALLKGALPNLTIINEPTKLDNNSNNNNNNGGGNQQNNRANSGGLSATVPQLLPQSASNNETQQQQAKNVFTSNAGAINKNSLPTNVAASATKVPTMQLQLNASPSAVSAAVPGTTGATLQLKLPQQSPQQQPKQQYQQPQLMTNSSTVGNTRTPEPPQETMIQQQQQQQQQQPMLPQLNQTAAQSNTLLATATLAALSQQRYVALPKINPGTQQIFCLNSENNQITPISPTQTTASIGPTERLLIAPAGINAQQLAQCLQQGQIHFNDVNPLPPSTQPQPTPMGMNAMLSSNQQIAQQQRMQPPQQQIVHPQPILPLNCIASNVNTTATVTSTISATTVTKQVANVAPIIDQSKAKMEPTKSAAATGAVAKKKPVRKPKATTTAADVASGTAGIKNASVVKPMPKLDPLSQKPNNNPVQIVQPNVASGKQIGASTVGSNLTTTTGINSIQPFQSLQQTTKLVGVTAPMQQLIASPPAAGSVTNVQHQHQQQLQPSSSAPMLLQSPNVRGFVSNANVTTTTTTTVNSGTLVSTANTSSTMTLTTATLAPPSLFSSNEPPSLSALNSSGSSNAAQQSQLQSQQHTHQQPQQQQHTVSRVQTIHLTAQQQQLFKQVQMQIQFLTIKLQHKSLLTSLPLPPDFDPTAIAAYTKPMSDAEINIVLQRLYMEQQRILAAGKEVPTPEALLQIPQIGNGAGITLMSQPSQLQHQAATGKVIPSGIPANVVQPNNHSTTMTVSATTLGSVAAQQQVQTQAQSSVTHRIHIYPMQHHQTVQQNKQQQQQQQQPKLQQSPATVRGKESANTKGKTLMPPQQQVQNSNTNSTLMLSSSQKQQHQQSTLVPVTKAPALLYQQQHTQQQHQQLLMQKSAIVSSASSNANLMSGPPPLVFSSPVIATAVATTAATSNSSTTVFTSSSNGFLQAQQQQHQNLQPLHAFSQAQTCVVSAAATTSSTPVPLPVFTTLSSNSNVTTCTTATSPITNVNSTTCVTIFTGVTTSTTTTIPTTATSAAAAAAVLPPASTIESHGHKSCYTSVTTTTTVGTNVIKTEENLSPQPKLARLSLFLRQLELDQQACTTPDYLNPFQDKEEAVKRLIRYHCIYESDEDIPFEEEERFERNALQYQEKYHKISTKYQKILLQESTLAHRTSETCQIQQLMIDDLRSEMEHLRNIEREQALYEQQRKDLHKQEQEGQKLDSMRTAVAKLKQELEVVKDDPEVVSNKSIINSSAFVDVAHVKDEIKVEPSDNNSIVAVSTSNTGTATTTAKQLPILDKFDLLKHSTSDNAPNICNKQQRTPHTQEQRQQPLSGMPQNETFPKKDEKPNWHCAATSTPACVGSGTGESDAVKGKLAGANFNSPSNKQLNGMLKRDTAPPTMSAYVKKEFENFDIESEITPSFIMKKVEHKEVLSSSPQEVSSAKPHNKQCKERVERCNTHEQQHQQKTSTIAPPSHSFAAQYLQHNSKQQQLQQQQQQQLKQQQQHQLKHHQQQQQQEDDWLCLQKELNLITTENKIPLQQQPQQLVQQLPQQSSQAIKAMNLFENSPSADGNRSMSTVSSGQSGHLMDLFPNGCINKNSGLSSSNTSNEQQQICNQQRLPPLGEEQQQNAHESATQSSHHHIQSSLNEFFDSGDDMADVHKSVETRLEAMFGESPVHLSKSGGNDTHDIEAGLEDIFGDAKSSHNITESKSKQQRLWDNDLSANSFMRVTNGQEGVLFENDQQQLQLNQQQMQQTLLNINNSTSRWMQNIDGAFGDFIADTNDCGDSRKRRWNGDLMSPDDDDTLDGNAEQHTMKKMCSISGSSSSSSPLSQQQQQQHQPPQHHHESIMEADLLSLHDGIRVEPAAAQMLQMATQQQHVFCQAQQQFTNLLDGVDHHQQHFAGTQQQHHHNHDMHQQQQHAAQQHHHSHLQAQAQNHHVGGGDFDDDISRHVQNAIDSILNLQNSESADSLNFSLDHSMGSLLGESILDERQQQQAAVSIHDGVKRRHHHLVDELGDCLISGGGSGTAAGDNASTILLDSNQHHHAQQQALLNQNQHHHMHQNNHHHQQQQHQTQQQPMLNNDFSCVAAGIVDEAVKSIMTS